MAFANEEKALYLLEKIGYYRLSAYWYPLLADKKSTFSSQTLILKPLSIYINSTVSCENSSAQKLKK